MKTPAFKDQPEMKHFNARTTSALAAALLAACALPLTASAAVVPLSMTNSSGYVTSVVGATTFNNFDGINLTSVATVSGGIANYGANDTGSANFLTASSTAPITVVFTGLQDYLGFWWGTNDTTYNIVSFYKGSTLVSTATGNGSSAFTNFFASSPSATFDKVVFSMPASTCCFEIDNLASRAVNASAVPEPGVLALVGTGLFLAGAARRRRQG